MTKAITFAQITKKFATFFPEIGERLIMDVIMSELLENDELIQKLILSIERRRHIGRI